jgi:hypothetical protein
MRSSLRLFLLLPLASLLACGSNSPAASTPPPSGDWIFKLSSSTVNAGYFAGTLTIQQNNVSGILQYYDPPSSCTPGVVDIPVTGTVNTSGSTMTLTSASFGGSVATFTVQLPLISTATPNYAFGTAVVAGGSCALASSQMSVNYVNFGGNFAGSLTGGTVTGQVGLSVLVGAPNTNGQFAATGTITFTSPTCSLASSGNLSGLIAGYSLQLSNGTINLTANASVSPIQVAVSGVCNVPLTGSVQ